MKAKNEILVGCYTYVTYKKLFLYLQDRPQCYFASPDENKNPFKNVTARSAAKWLSHPFQFHNFPIQKLLKDEILTRENTAQNDIITIFSN